MKGVSRSDLMQGKESPTMQPRVLAPALWSWSSLGLMDVYWLDDSSVSRALLS